MNLDQASRWRNSIGRLGALFCVLFILSGFDGLVAQFRTPPNEFLAMPGETINVNGPCSTDIQDVSQLAYESSSAGIRLQFEALQSGFWLGGAMWRGLLFLGRDLQPGNYGVIVRPGNDSSQKPFSVFAIKVFSSPAAQRQASKSLIQRNFGISPWLVFSVCVGLTGIAFALIFGVSQKRDSLMAVQGRAEIYRVAKEEGFYEVAFGLGAVHGIRTGDLLTLLNHRGERVGQVAVTRIFDQDAAGTVDPETVVKPGFVVTKDS